jgi:hypothetical protein
MSIFWKFEIDYTAGNIAEINTVFRGGNIEIS